MRVAPPGAAAFTALPAGDRVPTCTMLLLLLIASFTLLLGTASAQGACVDDAQGYVAALGYDCPTIAAWGCDVDVHAFSPLVPVGSTIGLFCPSTCDSCGATAEDAVCSAQTAPARVTEVMRACCPHTGKGGGHRLMQNDVPQCDLPEVCPSDECAATFNSFMDDCQTWLMNSPGMPIQDFHRFYLGCQQLLIHDTHDPVTCRHVHGGWEWSGLPCEPGLEVHDRDYHAEPDGTERCLCHRVSNDAMVAYGGPSSAAQCAHVLCHSYGDEGFWFDSCSFDSVEVATGEQAPDKSQITITSDPSKFCVTCQSAGAGDDVTWQWTNLPCLPGIDREDTLRQQGNQDDFTGAERCICHRASNGDMIAWEGPTNAAQCGHMLCHNQIGEYYFDSCTWDGTVVATASAGFDTLTTITSHPDHLCATEDPVQPTCIERGGNWFWSDLECAPLMEAGDRGYDETPEGDERCTCHKISDGSTYAYDGPTSAAECGHLICHAYGPQRGPRAAGRYYFDACSWEGEVVATARPDPAGHFTTLTSDPGRLCVTCESNDDGFVWQNLPCEPSIEYSERGYDAHPEGDERCLCHASRTDSVFAYDGPQNRGQCGHIICHKTGGRYIFDECSWDGAVVSTGEHKDHDSYQTITSNPTELCVDIPAETVTCRQLPGQTMNGEDPGWSWSNLNCEPGVEIENWALDTRPEGNERCVCTLADPAYGRDVNQGDVTTHAFDGPASASQCGHLLCVDARIARNKVYKYSSCSWDGRIVATATPDAQQRFTTITSGAENLCGGITPDPLGKCRGSWVAPDRNGCTGIIGRGRAVCGTIPCDGLSITGDSWTPGHDENGHYVVGSGTGNFLTYTQNLGGSASCVDDSDFRDQAGFRCSGWGSSDGGYDCTNYCVDTCGPAAIRNGYSLGNDLAPVREACPRACGLCTSDFTMTVQMKLFNLDGSAGTFMVNDGHFGFEGACQCTFTEGGFFGGVLNTDLDSQCADSDNSGHTLGMGCTDPAEHGFVEGRLMTFRVSRRGSTFEFWASELLVHTYESDAEVTSLGFRPHRATFQIYDWQLVRHSH